MEKLRMGWKLSVLRKEAQFKVAKAKGGRSRGILAQKRGNRNKRLRSQESQNRIELNMGS